MTEREIQNKCRDFVQREVIYCVSSVISELAKNESSDYWDDILGICSTDDYQSPAEDEGYEVFEQDGDYYWRDKDGGLSDEWFEEEDDAWRNCCEENSLDPFLKEAYEHWIVSNFLARRLAEKGEMVSTDICGMTVWGRTTTGQAILLDRVIRQIVQEIEVENMTIA